jgi:uncharacterized protein (TIGR02596 family)
MRKIPGKIPGFTLIEMMVVMAVMVVLIAVSLPALKTVVMGTSLTQAGHLLSDQFQLARQEAAGRNREVQVRLVWTGSEPAGYRGIQLWASSLDDVTLIEPIAKMVLLPQGTLISSNTMLSPLLAHATISETNAVFPGRGMTKYCGYRFRPGGETDLPFNSSDNFLTVVQNKDAAATAAPPNFYVVQVDPVNGRTRSFRP